jgi:hypothetical protein
MTATRTHQTIADPIKRANASSAYWRKMATAVEGDPTETVSVLDLTADSVITRLGNVTLPFAFQLTTAQRINTEKVLLRAAHGWFAVVNASDTADRVIFGS